MYSSANSKEFVEIRKSEQDIYHSFTWWSSFWTTWTFMHAWEWIGSRFGFEKDRWHLRTTWSEKIFDNLFGKDVLIEITKSCKYCFISLASRKLQDLLLDTTSKSTNWFLVKISTLQIGTIGKSFMNMTVKQDWIAVLTKLIVQRIQR